MKMKKSNNFSLMKKIMMDTKMIEMKMRRI
jgi:hypothetical protein